MRITSIMLVLIFLISCNQKLKNVKDDNDQNDFNQVVDNIVRYKLNSVSVVQTETVPIFKEVPFDSAYMEIHGNIPPPPPPGLINYSKHFFNAMVERELIDSLDANYMYSNIDSSLTINIDSSLISKTLLSKSFLDSIFEIDFDSAYTYLQNKYGTGCYINVGTPVFNYSKTRLILAVDYHCGPLYGQGYIFILKKENDKWTIIEEFGTWVS